MKNLICRKAIFNEIIKVGIVFSFLQKENGRVIIVQKGINCVFVSRRINGIRIPGQKVKIFEFEWGLCDLIFVGIRVYRHDEKISKVCSI